MSFSGFTISVDQLVDLLKEPYLVNLNYLIFENPVLKKDHFDNFGIGKFLSSLKKFVVLYDETKKEKLIDADNIQILLRSFSS